MPDTNLCARCQQAFGSDDLVLGITSHTRRTQSLLISYVHLSCVTELNKIIGLPGPQGIQGTRGHTGQEGPTGKRGPEGVPGRQGESGPQGQPGDKGEPGEPGSRGERGERGNAGPRGARGERGAVGADGPQGERGESQLAAIKALRKEFTHLRKVVGETPLTGTIVCPECSAIWDTDKDLHVKNYVRVVMRCTCGTELVITPKGVERKHA